MSDDFIDGVVLTAVTIAVIMLVYIVAFLLVTQPILGLILIGAFSLPFIGGFVNVARKKFWK